MSATRALKFYKMKKTTSNTLDIANFEAFDWNSFVERKPLQSFTYNSSISFFLTISIAINS